MKLASGFQIAQVRPANTSTATAYTASIRTEVTLIVVANTTGTAATFSIYHDDDGSTYDQSTAIYYAVSLAANTTQVVSLEAAGGLMVSDSGTIGVQSGTASAITYTFYGHTTDLRVNNV